MPIEYYMNGILSTDTIAPHAFTCIIDESVPAFPF